LAIFVIANDVVVALVIERFGKIDACDVEVAMTYPTVGELEALSVIDPPRETAPPPVRIPEEFTVMDELVRPALSSVPDTVGVKVKEFVVGTMRIPSVRPLAKIVEVANVMALAVVVDHPLPSAEIDAAMVVGRHTPFTEKHPLLMFIPRPNVEVELFHMLIVSSPVLPIASGEPGDVLAALVLSPRPMPILFASSGKFIRNLFWKLT
jgi:hypothetical protein